MRLVRRNSVPTFAKVLDTFFNEEAFKNTEEGLTMWNGTQPAVNIKEDADAYCLEMAAPGYDKGAFEIKIEQDVLIISSEKQEVQETTENEAETKAKEVEKYTRREFKYAAFKRSFNLPETADAAKIAASYTNGILSISIPKKEEAKPLPARTIKVF